MENKPCSFDSTRRTWLKALCAAPALPALAGFSVFAQDTTHPLAARFVGGARAWVEGDWLLVGTRAIPDHGSPYFPAGDARLERFQGRNPMGYRFHQAPTQISPHDMILRIPRYPERAATVTRTPLGPIGVALNGVPFFNQYAGNGQNLSHEIVSFDQYNGHPTPHGMYHYHAEPAALTKRFGREALLGFLLDGFPVYGGVENGREVQNSDLDECHGHTHATKDFPGGIYHYHTTMQEPYLNGRGFYGQRGQIVRATFDPVDAMCATAAV